VPGTFSLTAEVSYTLVDYLTISYQPPETTEIAARYFIFDTYLLTYCTKITCFLCAVARIGLDFDIKS